MCTMCCVARGLGCTTRAGSYWEGSLLEVERSAASAGGGELKSGAAT